MGVHVVGAAGNENVDACTESPARASRIVGVGSTMLLTGDTDFFLGGSNFGRCVKMFAPGDKIISIGSSSDTAESQPDSGTSFASPHVAGVLARLAALHPLNTTEEVQKILFDSAIKGAIGMVPKATPNLLLHKACDHQAEDSAAVATAVATSTPPPPPPSFTEYASQHRKRYPDAAEAAGRHALYSRIAAEVDAHN
eukprot:1195374-Prymnesium_polylepis.1